MLPGTKLYSILLKVALYSTELGLPGRGSVSRTRFFVLEIHFLAGTANKITALNNWAFQRAVLRKSFKVQAPATTFLKENKSTHQAIQLLRAVQIRD